MKIQHLLAVIGGIVLLGSTVVPAHNTNLWGALELLDRDILIGAIPIVIPLCGVLAIVMGLVKNNLVALICGALSFIWLMAACRFQIYMLLLQPFFLVALLGSIVTIAGGIVGLTMRPTKNDILDN